LLQLKTLSIVILVQLIFSLFLGSLCGVAMCTVSNLFNTKIRCLSVGISVTIASGIFGGLSPTVCSYLINKTGYTLAPVFFLIAAGVVALISTLTLKPKELIMKDDCII
jgi:MFS transporter, MHS family, proline/betaine transporter